MAQFTNQAQLRFNDTVIESNVAVGEIREALTVSKTAVVDEYTREDTLTYVVSIRNTADTAVSGVTVTDNLGADTAPFPLSYVEGSLLVYENGELQTEAPVVVAGPPLVVSGLTVPAGGSLLLIYQAEVTPFASPEVGGTITNTATVTGQGVTTPVTAEETVTAQEAFDLTITKSIEPVPVTENGRLTYTLTIRNWGNRPVVATDDVIVTDTFDPILSDLVVTFNGQLWEEGVQYEYAQSTGAFSTNPGRITVPAATFTEDPVTGRWTVTPGEVTLVITGTV
ncbi:MAG: hypothetical protein J6R77_03425 [Clostridia bacterium]|nr:hypothetical protein [Clostridia bacterium]